MSSLKINSGPLHSHRPDPQTLTGTRNQETRSAMDRLGRYPISVVLSYLKPIEGVAFLITSKRFARQLLPVFRLPDPILLSDGRLVHQYRFQVVPVQDPSVLLDRLNTRRLGKRRSRPLVGLTTSELAITEWITRSNNKLPVSHELLRFLDYESAHNFHPTLLVSYPRSGNTLSRTLLERVTGIVTGSDTRPDRSLSKQLAEQHNLVGEGIVTSSCCVFCKTHYPERLGNRVYKGSRAILVVRNPYDSFDSYWNLNATKSHTKTLQSAVYDTFKTKWENLCRNEIRVWLDFLDYWLNTDIPVLLVRFEDLVADPAAQVTRMMQFSLRTSLNDFWKSRIDKICAESTAKLGSYKPRTSRIGKSLGKYTDELLKYIQQISKQNTRDYVRELGYSLPEFPETSVVQSPFLVNNERCGTVHVNAEAPIRGTDCEFGRRLQQWRHSVTDFDRNPLPTL